MKATIKPEMLVWARERAGFSVDALSSKFKKLALWEEGEESPTFKQLEAFAKAVHVPVGKLFLLAPPVEKLSIPDFRTVANSYISQPSTELIDTIHLCQQRQNWYRNYARIHQLDSIDFIGSLSTDTEPKAAANKIRATLNFNTKVRRSSANFEEAIRAFVGVIENAGIMVMMNGVVKHNTSRPLNPEEFRGFALVDDLAPLIFINAKDAKPAQIFTLAHEISHMFLGTTGLSDASAAPLGGHRKEEVWCNAVAAELLVPALEIPIALETCPDEVGLPTHLSKYFKVSRLVAIRRLLDEGFIKQNEFNALWAEAREEWNKKQSQKSGGGDFNRTAQIRNSKRFTSAIIRDTLAGRTLYRDAFQLLAVKPSSFQKQAHEMGITA